MSNRSYKDRKPLPKRLIICSDGTCESSVTGKRNIPSNVTRLARTIAKAGADDDGKEWQQIVYYGSGVATGSLDLIDEAIQAGIGEGLVENVLEGYNFLVNNYYPGDQVFCFGFSRGAFTARCIAGLVADIGIFKPDRMHDFAPLWALYQSNTAKHEFRKTKEFFQYVNGVQPMVPRDQVDQPYVKQPYQMAHGTDWAWPDSNHVEVLGCWDTVGSLGLSDVRFFNNAWSRYKYEYLNVKLSPYIKHAFHALALDERREPFTPTLFYIPNEATLAKEEAEMKKDEQDWPALKAFRAEIEKDLATQRAKHRPDLYQTWFPGVHINVGGGADKISYDGEGLSNITFAWMVQMLGPYLAFEPWTWGDRGIAGYTRGVVEEEWRYEHMPPSTKMTRMAAHATDWLNHKLGIDKEANLVPVPDNKVIDVDPQSPIRADGKRFRWAISEYQDSYNAMYAGISDPVTRKPGQCLDRSTETRTPLRELGQTNEYIHPAVEWRRRNLEHEADPAKRYESKALQGFVRTTDKNGATGYYKADTDIFIPEWYLKPAMSGSAECDAWMTAEWGLTLGVEDRDVLHKFLRDIHEANVRREDKKEAAKL